MNRACSVFSTLILITSVTSASAASSGCSVTVGQTAETTNAPELHKALSGGAGPKSEFETTAEYEVRQRQSSFLLGQTLLVEGTYYPEQVQYDADRQRFELSEYTWGNLGVRYDTVFPSGNQYGVPAVSIAGENHAVGLFREERTMREYDATNAFGSTVRVSQVSRETFGVYDRAAPPGEETWELEYAQSGDVLNDTVEWPGVYLPMPREKARLLKDKLRVAIEFEPRAPFLAQGQDYFEPRIERPTEIAEIIAVFIGSIKCAVIMDDQGMILKTVRTSYR